MADATRRYLITGALAWLPMPVLAIVNAALRELVLQPWLGETLAQPLSGVTLVATLAVYAGVVFRRAVTGARAGAAWVLGLIWAGLTLIFEYALLATSQDAPLAKLAHALSPAAIQAGNLFALAVIFVLFAPRLFRRPAPAKR